MKIRVYSIEKSSRDDYQKIIEKFKKMIQKYAVMEEIEIFDKKIAKAQNSSDIMAKSSYSEAFMPYMKGLNIALDPKGKELDSFEFSNIFDSIQTLNFFIAGAYGFDRDFLKKFDMVISLSSLTFSHKIAKVVLFEQIYRGLSIKHSHPYHK